jgi:hypothetical protein
MVLTVIWWIPMAQPAALADSDKVVCLVAKVVSTNGYTITLQPVESAVTTYKLSPFAAVLVDGREEKASDLRPGFQANVILSGSQVNAVYARSNNTETWGTISSISASMIALQPKNGTPLSFALTQSTKETLYGKPALAGDVKVGQLADVTCAAADSATAISVDVVNPAIGTVHGQIKSVAANSITILSQSGGSDETSTFTIDSSTVVTVDGRNAALTDVHANQTATVSAPDGDLATVIAISTESDRRHRGRGDQGAAPAADSQSGSFANI